MWVFFCRVEGAATLTKVWVALPWSRNLSSVNIAKCDPKFSGWKNLENRQKHQKRRSGCVGQADFGKLELNNIRNDSGNCHCLSVKRDQFETRSIRNKRGRMFRPSRFRGRTRELLAFAILRLLRIRCLHLVWLASCKTYSCSPSTYSGFEIWVLRFRVLGASCFGLRFRVLRFRNYNKLPEITTGNKRKVSCTVSVRFTQLWSKHNHSQFQE